jgi:class 3 adenylate cyclase
VSACPSCGRENAEDARFCSACGTSLAAEPAREQRKVVTVLFCDLVGSTALGESTDPEVVRARLARTFEELRTILERHGGSVEKFVGDAVMAVFGIPTAHEDDALRAVRAASEMREAIVEHGLEARIGINTGEVVVGAGGETLVTGDAVNVAARLEQAAPPGEILVGAETRLLVRDAVRVAAVEPLALKGKAEPVDAFRLLEVRRDADALTRHLETPLVGRERERQRLWRDFEDAVADSTCRLFTLLGPAGIGKSRLVADFLERIGDSADVLRGRCLSYGEGITYWPLVEILLAIGVDPDSVIGTSPPETQLAFRRLLEARAAERPQVVVIDDLQWAEPVFVDLVEHVADLSRDSPIFLLCVARTELLDARPEWGGGKLNATSLLLEPLGAAECDALMERLAGGAALGDELRVRIATAAAGNPLYVEEMLAMVREHGGESEISVPPTIHALLQARIDSLDGDVRVVMERGSVEGEVFHRGAVAELSPPPVREGVETHLQTLVRKELIRSTTPQFPQDEGFRFRHLLIRDAAYESLPKGTRAELHESFAGWLAMHDLVESDEIVGYHLEQAHRYRAELDAVDGSLPGLAARASEHLSSAGRGALERGDFNAARTLLMRATGLLASGDARRLALAPYLCDALWEAGDTEGMATVIADARQAADPVVRAIAELLAANLELYATGRSSSRERVERRDAARGVLEAAGQDQWLSLYWWSVGFEAWFQLRAEETMAASERSLVHAQRAGSSQRARDAVHWILASSIFGPMPVRAAIQRVEEMRRAEGASLLGEGHAPAFLGMLVAMEGDVARGLFLVRKGIATIREAGLDVTAAGMAMGEAWVAQNTDPEAAEQALRSALDVLEPTDRGYRPTTALQLAELLYRQGRCDEVEELCAHGRELTTAHDLVNFVYLDAIEGCLCARRGQHDKATERARHAVALAETSDFYEIRGIARLYLAEVLTLVGKTDAAAAEAGIGLGHFEAKGDVTSASRARRRLTELGIEVAG